MSKNIAIVTGASSGLGAEFAKQISENSKIDEVWLIARREEKLKEVAKAIPNSKVKSMDLLAADAVDELVEAIGGNKVQVLVNNAGFGRFRGFNEEDWSVWQRMIELNMRVVTETCYKLFSKLNTNAEVINIASSAGYMTSSTYNVYAATKAYVLNFSIGLRAEWKQHGINVLAVCPGPVATEFFDKAGISTKEAPLPTVAPAKVVTKALKDSARGSATSIYGWGIKLFVFLTRFLPKSLLARLG